MSPRTRPAMGSLQSSSATLLYRIGRVVALAGLLPGCTQDAPLAPELTASCFELGDYVHLVNRVDSGGEAVAIAGSHAYVVGASLHVVDISNPDQPVVVGRVVLPS